MAGVERDGRRLFDRPLWADWIAYLAAAGMFAGLSTVAESYGGWTRIGEQPFAAMIDATIAVGFQFAVFGLLPATIRRTLRRRHAEEVDLPTAPTIEAPTGRNAGPPTGADSDVRRPTEQVPPPQVNRRILAAVAVAVVLLGAADWYQRNRELTALLDAVEDSEVTMKNGRDQVEDLVEQANRTGVYSGRDGVIAEMQVAAGAAAVEVKDTGLLVSEVPVVPWHGALRTARRSYVRHSDVWAEYFDDVAALEKPDTFSDISPTFKAARRAFARAAPPLALDNADGRIEVVFEG